MKEEQSIDEIIVNAVNKGKMISYVSKQDWDNPCVMFYLYLSVIIGEF